MAGACALPENLFPHHPLETNSPAILIVPTSKRPVDLNQVSREARQWVRLCLSTNQETAGSESELCWSAIMRGMHGTSAKKTGVLLPKQAL
jgi:hypothetical protein